MSVPTSSRFSMTQGSTPGSTLGSGSALGSVSGAIIAHTDNPFKNKLIGALGIPPELANHADNNLHFAWQKYKAFLAACRSCDELWTARKLDGLFDRKPSKTDIIGVFKGKTQWHVTYAKAFPKVSAYPNMVDWLEDKTDKLSDVELWGATRPTYGFSELLEWLGNNGQGLADSGSGSEGEIRGKELRKAKGKAKEKEKEKVKGKGKERRKEKDGSGEEKKKKKAKSKSHM